jgi:hypothetical protein
LLSFAKRFCFLSLSFFKSSFTRAFVHLPCNFLLYSVFLVIVIKEKKKLRRPKIAAAGTGFAKKSVADKAQVK